MDFSCKCEFNLWSAKGVLTFKFWTTNETQDRFEFASTDCLHPWGCGHSFLIPKERCNEGLIYIGLIYWIDPNFVSRFHTGNLLLLNFCNAFQNVVSMPGNFHLTLKQVAQRRPKTGNYRSALCTSTCNIVDRSMIIE